MPHKYDALGAALRASAGPPPPEKPKKRGGWRKWLVVYLWLSAITGIWQLTFGTKEKPVPAVVAAPAAAVQDTVVSPQPTALATPAPEPPPPPPPVAEEAPPVAKPQKSITVYTTRTGDKYHRSGCSSLRKSRNATTLNDAQAMGYDPCGRCRPPR